MSIIRCDQCGALIDTDYDVEAYSERLDRWYCVACRDEQEDEDNEN